MTQFKVVNTSTQPYKTKGSWIVKPDDIDENGQLKERSLSPPKPLKPHISRFKTNCYLLESPRDIRERIYDYVWDGGFFAMSPMSLSNKVTGDQIGAEMRACSGIDFITDNHAIHGRRLVSVKARSEVVKGELSDFNWLKPNGDPKRAQKPTNVGLMLTCKELYDEFSERVHRTSIFGFGSSKKIRQFLSDGERGLQESLRAKATKPLPPSSDNKSLIKSLYVNIPAYNEPIHTKDRIFVVRYYQGWANACARLASETDVKDLTISVQVPDNKPYRLALNELWVSPLLEFAKGKAKLKTAAVKLISPKNALISPKSLEAFAEVLHRKLLGWDDASALEAITSRKIDNPPQIHNNLHEEYKTLEKWNDLYDYGEDMIIADDERHLRKAQALLLTMPRPVPIIAVPKPPQRRNQNNVNGGRRNNRQRGQKPKQAAEQPTTRTTSKTLNAESKEPALQPPHSIKKPSGMSCQSSSNQTVDLVNRIPAQTAQALPPTRRPSPCVKPACKPVKQVYSTFQQSWPAMPPPDYQSRHEYPPFMENESACKGNRRPALASKTNLPSVTPSIGRAHRNGQKPVATGPARVVCSFGQPQRALASQ